MNVFKFGVDMKLDIPSYSIVGKISVERYVTPFILVSAHEFKRTSEVCILFATLNSQNYLVFKIDCYSSKSGKKTRKSPGFLVTGYISRFKFSSCYLWQTPAEEEKGDSSLIVALSRNNILLLYSVKADLKTIT